MKLFGVDIAKEVNRAAGSGLLPATLTVVTAGERVPGRLAHGTEPTTEDYPCRGVLEDYTERQIDGDIVRVGDRRVLLLGASISGGAVVPKPTDRITIESVEYTIARVERDPAAATYVCQVRR